MLADRNDAITSIMALSQQKQHLKQCLNYGKEIKKKKKKGRYCSSKTETYIFDRHKERMKRV